MNHNSIKKNFFRFHNIKISFIILLSCILILLIIFKSKNFNIFQILRNNTLQNPIINNYKLSNITDSHFISILLDYSHLNFNFTDISLLKFISKINQQIFKDFQILLLGNRALDIISNISKNDSRFEFFVCENKDLNHKLMDISNKIKGKFFILINETVKIEKDTFQRIYNNIKGSNKNIFKINFQNITNHYLIRTKILRDILDYEYEFENYTQLINFIYSYPIPNLNYIPVAYCPNNYYAALTYVSMISILVSKSVYSYILFFLIITTDFSDNNIQLIESLYEQFDYFNITFIKMDDRYERAYTRRYLSKSAFFRLSLGELIPNLNKIIYLDSDTICLKDLSNMYNLNTIGKIFLATPLTFNKENLNFTVNTGVLLLNLKKMRKMEIEKHVLTLLNNNFTDSFLHDQAIINIFYKKYIGFLPPEFNRFKTFKNYLQDYFKDSGGLFDFDSLYFYLKFPSILHFPGPPDSKTYKYEDWYYFARKSKYFQNRSHNYSNIFNHK